MKSKVIPILIGELSGFSSFENLLRTNTIQIEEQITEKPLPPNTKKFVLKFSLLANKEATIRTANKKKKIAQADFLEAYDLLFTWYQRKVHLWISLSSSDPGCVYRSLPISLKQS